MLNHLFGLTRRTVVRLGKEEKATGIRRAEIGAAEKRFYGFVVNALRIVGDTQTDCETRRRGVTLRSIAEDLDCGLKRPVEEQFAGPVEEIGFTWILVGGGFELVGRNHVISFLLFNVAKKVVQFRSVLVLQKIMD